MFPILWEQCLSTLATSFGFDEAALSAFPILYVPFQLHAGLSSLTELLIFLIPLDSLSAASRLSRVASVVISHAPLLAPQYRMGTSASTSFRHGSKRIWPIKIDIIEEALVCVVL